MKYRYKRRLSLLLAAISLACLCTACQKDQAEDGQVTQVVFTTGFEADELFRIGAISCKKSEYMVYLTNMQNEYEAIYGPQIWDETIDNATLGDKMQQVVLARIAQIKTMNLLAKEQNLELSQEDIQRAAEGAKQYFDSLNDTERTLLEVEYEDIQKLYEEYALANKVYQLIIKDTNPEISDDEARMVTVSQILIRTTARDEKGQEHPFSQDGLNQARRTMEDIKKQLSHGEDFDSLAARYNEADQITISFPKGEVDMALEEVAFNLGKDEVSDIIKTQEGLIICKCISTLDREQTDIRKVQILNQRKEEAFSSIYDDFTKTQIRDLNDELFESLTYIHDENVTTQSFFKIFNELFQEPDSSL